MHKYECQATKYNLREKNLRMHPNTSTLEMSADLN